MSIADEFRNNYEPEQDNIEFLKLGAENVAQAVIDFTKGLSKTERGAEGYFSVIYENDYGYGLLKEPQVHSPFDIDPSYTGRTITFSRIEDFGQYKEGILSILERTGESVDKVCFYTDNQIDAAISTIKNKLVDSGFSNVDVSYTKLGANHIIYGTRKPRFFESINPNADWLGKEICQRTEMPNYGLFISFSW